MIDGGGLKLQSYRLESLNLAYLSTQNMLFSSLTKVLESSHVLCDGAVSRGYGP